MNSLQEIRSKLSEQLPTLKKKYPIATLAIFGSYSRGTQNENSDIDIMVEFNGSMGWNYFDLYDDLQTLFKNKVDLVSRGGIQNHYWEYLKDKMIYV